MSAPGQPGFAPAVMGEQLEPGWYPDPLDSALLRYFDGTLWTFWTSTVAPQGQPMEAQDGEQAPPTGQVELRPDIASAIAQASNMAGAGKELRLLAQHLAEEETVAVAVAGLGAGFGALVVTNQRVLFYFEGMMRRQFLSVDLDSVHELHYDEATKSVQVFTGRRTRRAVPALSIVVNPREDGRRFVEDARRVLAQPRLGMR